MLVTLVTRVALNRLGVRVSWVTLLLLLLSGCGHAAAHSESSGSAGAAGAAAEEPSTGGSSMAGMELEPGTCGIARRIPLPFDNSSAQATVARQGGGFSLGPWASGDSSSGVRGLFIGANGQERRPFAAEGSSNNVHWPLFLGAVPIAVDVYVGADPTPGDDVFELRGWAEGDTVANLHGTLLQARWRGTDAIHARPALDGKRAVFAVWPLGMSEPRAAMIGPDGARIGEAHSLAPVGHTFSTCENLTPTEHGGLISFVDIDDQALHLIELGPDGEPVFDVSRKLSDSNLPCPLLALDDAGFTLLAPSTDEGQPSTLYRLDHGGTITEAPILLTARPIAIGSSAQGTLVLQQRARELLLTQIGPAGPREFPLRTTPNSLVSVPSEPGRIFVDAQSLEGGVRELLELTCQ